MKCNEFLLGIVYIKLTSHRFQLLSRPKQHIRSIKYPVSYLISVLCDLYTYIFGKILCKPIDLIEVVITVTILVHRSMSRRCGITLIAKLIITTALTWLNMKTVQEESCLYSFSILILNVDFILISLDLWNVFDVSLIGYLFLTHKLIR